MDFKIGGDYKTRGGWKARVIFITTVEEFSTYSSSMTWTPGKLAKRALLVIHKPGEADESGCIVHKLSGEYVSPCGLVVLGCKEPRYDAPRSEHPADLIEAL